MVMCQKDSALVALERTMLLVGKLIYMTLERMVHLEGEMIDMSLRTLAPGPPGRYILSRFY